MPKSTSAPRRAALAALLLSAAACTDRLPTEITPPLDGERVRTEIACTVTVADARMRCDVPASAGGASASVLLGGQGTYVRLESTNLAYDADTDVFSMDVIVQNLLSHQMGTPDGVTVTGVKVFFEQMPTATEGSGDITLLNEDGEGSFTQVMQPYFEYPQILEPRGLSEPRTWRFGVPGTVQRFGFKVYVSTELPAEQGVLRWKLEHGGAVRDYKTINGVWGASRDLVYGVAGNSILLFNRHENPDMRYWEPIAQGPATLNTIWGTSRSDIYAAGDSGVVMRYDGNRWTVRRAPTAPHQVSGLWSGGSDVWAVGRRQESGASDVDGLLLHSGDAGESWTETVSAGDGKRYLRDVFRAGDRVYAVGYEDPLVAGASPRAGVVLRSDDGGQTWSDSLLTEFGAVTLHTVWADGPLDVYVGGEVVPPGGSRQAFILHTTDGGATWTTASPHAGYIYSMSRIPGGDLLAVGGGNFLANDGSGWRDLSMSCSSVSAGWRGVWASSLDDVFLTLGHTIAFHRDAGCMRWTYQAIVGNNLRRAAAVSMTPDAGLVAGTQYAEAGMHEERAVVLSRTPWGGWTINYNGPDYSAFEDVWVKDPYNLMAVGWWDVAGQRRGFIMRRSNNSFWTDVSPPAAADVPLTAVWRTGDVSYVFGVRAGSPASIVVFRTDDDGATWRETPIPYTGTGTPQVTDAWGSSAGAIHVSGYAESGEAEEGFTLRYDGSSWTLAVGDNGRLTGVWSSGSTVVMSGYRDAGTGWTGFVRTSQNGGDSWTEAALPASSADGRIEGIWGVSPTTLYAVGTGGGVYRYDGTGWKAVMGRNGANLFGVGGTSDTDVYAVGADGAIYHGMR